jgi:hypothetical protein
MFTQRWCYGGVLAAFAAPVLLRAQERPLTVGGTLSSGFYSTTTRGDATQSASFVPVGARFDINGYFVSPDLVSVSAQPELNLGPQASDAGFQGGNGATVRVTLLRKSIMPLTVRYSNVQVENVYFGSLSQLSGYTLRNRNKDVGVTWEFRPRGWPATLVDWGLGSVDSKSGTAGVSDYQSQGNHLNVDSKYEWAGWDLHAFLRRNRQESNLLAPIDGGTHAGTLRETVMETQVAARRSFLGDSEFYVNGGSQSTSSLLFALPIDLTTRFVGANLRLRQRRRWKASLRANYTSNLASQLLERAAGSLSGPGTVVPDRNVLVPFARGMANVTLNGVTSVTVGHGLGFYGSVERSAMFSSRRDNPLDSDYFTTSAGVTYARKFGWGNLAGEYAREFGVGSLTGQSGTIQGQHYVFSAQHGSPGGLQFDGSVRGSDQTVHTALPLRNNSFSAEAGIANRVAGSFSARLGGGWQWGSMGSAANEFRSNGYTARAGLEHPRIQVNASLNNSLGNSLSLYDQLLGGFGIGQVLDIPLQIIPSTYRAKSVTLHSNPLRKFEISGSWAQSSQHLAGVVSNTFEILNVYLTYQFRKLQVEAGFIRSNQRFSFHADTLRQRFYVRVVRSARFL